MWPWHVKIHANSSNVTQHLITTSCRQFWQPCCWQLNKTKAMLMMQDEKKLCCWCKICPKCNIDFSKFWHEFICFDMDLSKTLYGFLEVVAWVYRVVYLFLAICQKKLADLWPRFQSWLKLLLWTKCVDWVKAFNASGPLCLCQCFHSVTEFLCSDLFGKNTIIQLYQKCPNSFFKK